MCVLVHEYLFAYSMIKTRIKLDVKFIRVEKYIGMILICT